MSARFALFRWPAGLNALPGFPAELQPRWNIAPGQQVLMLHQAAGRLQAAMARWGLTPAWFTDLSRTPAHARVETVVEQPVFRDAFRQRRCLVPANGFYEWRGVRKRPYWIGAAEGPLLMAGLWEAYPVGTQVYLSLALLTQPSAGLRRPLLLGAAQQAAWLDADTPVAQLQALLVQPQPALRERAVGPQVNDPSHDGPECLTPA